MIELVTNLQLLRPAWLLLLPVLWLLQWWWEKRATTAGWGGHIAADKIEILRIDSKRSRTHAWLLAITSAIVCIALSGPSLHALPGTVAGNRQAMVILFDLSPSMLARDVTPSRLDVARFKLIDLLRRRTDGDTALIAYAGDAHRVSPLTNDHTVIENLVPTLHPEIMPVPGNQPEEAVALALDLFAGAELNQGDIVFITDGIPEAAVASINTQLPDTYRVSILAIGTAFGAPIPLGDTGFLRDQNNALVMANLDSLLLEKLAASHNGRFANTTVDDTDIDHLNGLTPLPFQARVMGELQSFDQLHDSGYWLALFLIPLALYSFRRQVLWVLLPASTLLPLVSPSSEAAEWIDLWRNRNQQATAALQRGDHETAQQLFTDSKWKAVAAFKNGNYGVAATLLQPSSSADDYYNLGTVLAASGDFKRSIEALDHALALYGNPNTPGFADALVNRTLVLQWMQQQAQAAEEEESSERDAGSNNQDEPGNDSDVEGEESDRAATSTEQPTVGGTVGAGNSLAQNPLEQQGTSGSRQETSAEEVSDAAKDATTVHEPGAITNANSQEGFEADSGATTIENHNSSVLNPYSEQWLRNLPQDPGGYMRRKFHYQIQTRRQNQSNELQAEQHKLTTDDMRY